MNRRAKLVGRVTALTLNLVLTLSADVLATPPAAPVVAEEPATDVAADLVTERALLDALQQKIARANDARRVETTSAEVASGSATPWRPLLEMFGFAVGLALMAFGAVIVVRKTKAKNATTPSLKAMEVVESMWLGRGHRLLLVRVGMQRMLVGISGGAIQTITPIEGAVEVPVAAPQKARAAVGDSNVPAVAAAAAGSFRDMVELELAQTFKPSRKDRSRILHQLNTL